MGKGVSARPGPLSVSLFCTTLDMGRSKNIARFAARIQLVPARDLDNGHSQFRPRCLTGSRARPEGDRALSPLRFDRAADRRLGPVG
jgi:hypothetical protein